MECDSPAGLRIIGDLLHPLRGIRLTKTGPFHSARLLDPLQEGDPLSIVWAYAAAWSECDLAGDLHVVDAREFELEDHTAHGLIAIGVLQDHQSNPELPPLGCLDRPVGEEPVTGPPHVLIGYHDFLMRRGVMFL